MQMYGYFEGFPVRIVKHMFYIVLLGFYYHVIPVCVCVCVSPLRCYENL